MRRNTASAYCALQLGAQERTAKLFLNFHLASCGASSRCTCWSSARTRAGGSPPAAGPRAASRGGRADLGRRRSRRRGCDPAAQYARAPSRDERADGGACKQSSRIRARPLFRALEAVRFGSRNEPDPSMTVGRMPNVQRTPATLTPQRQNLGLAPGPQSSTVPCSGLAEHSFGLHSTRVRQRRTQQDLIAFSPDCGNPG